jgi:hypothetical protein
MSQQVILTVGNSIMGDDGAGPLLSSLLRRSPVEEGMMIDRSYVEKAADAGVGKVSLLQEDPLRYMLRAVGAGMGLTVVVSTFWVLKQNLHDISMGAVIASGFFGVGLMIIVFTNTDLFTSNNMYLTVSSREGRTSWRQTIMLWISCYFGNLAGAILVAILLVGAGSLGQLPPDHALFDGALHKAQQAGSVIFFKGILAVQGGSSQNPSPDSHRVHLRISWLRTLNRQHGDVLDGDSWGRYPDPGRSTAQPALQHRRKRGGGSFACWVAVHLSQSTRT